MGKGGLHRLAGIVNVEHNSHGIRCYNIEPGFTMTEALRTALGPSSALDENYQAIEPIVSAETVAWLIENDDECRYCHKDINVPRFHPKFVSGK